MTGRALVVILEDGLPAYRVNGLWAAIKQHPGIERVTDLSCISLATLELLLLPSPPISVETPVQVVQTPGLFSELEPIEVLLNGL